jgi:hypothetical protein
MSMAKIDVKGASITVHTAGDKDFISLKDMLRAKEWVAQTNAIGLVAKAERDQLGWDIRSNPDAMACVVNLSNAGIFTPPELGGRIQRVGSDKTGHWQIIESAS